MNDVEFKRMLDYRPEIGGLCDVNLKTLIYGHYESVGYGPERANSFTNAYIEALYKQFVHRKA